MKKLFVGAWGLWLTGMVLAVGGCNGDPAPAASSGSSSSTSSSGTGGTGGTGCVPVDDENPCTDDVCVNGVPTSEPTAAGSPCPGGTQCDGLGVCVTLVCTGTLGFDAGQTLSVVNAPTSAATADLDGDGKPDLVFVSGASANTNVHVLRNLGNGTFASQVDFPAGLSPKWVTPADLDGDGKPDLALTDNSDIANEVSVLLNLGDGTFAPPVLHGVGSSSRSVAATDFDGDGKLDLAVTNSGEGTVSVLLNLGNGAFAPQQVIHVKADVGSLMAADLNDDGRPDLAVVNQYSDRVTVLFTACIP